MKKTLILITLLCSRIAFAQEPKSCVKAWTQLIPGDQKNFYLYIENHCGFIVYVLVYLKYVDKDGYRVAISDGLAIDDFTPTDKIRAKEELHGNNAVGAQIRSIEVHKK